MQLVKTTTSDKLILSGLYQKGDKSKPAVIHTHGFYGDFYANQFTHNLFDYFKSKNQAFITVQNRGTGIQTEFLTTDGEGQILGSFYERLEDSHIDITAWINYLKTIGYAKFVLMGHSLGTIKSIRYLFEGEYKDLITNLILLAPFDKNGFIEDFTNGKAKDYLVEAEKAITEGKGREQVPQSFEYFPVSYQTFASWYNQSELSCMFDFYRHKNYNYPILNKINIPVKIIVGDKDEFLYIPKYNNLGQVKQVLNNNIKNLSLHILPGCGHSFRGFEGELVERLVLDL